MAEYDFSTLSPRDFELLSRDLLQKELGIRLESFKTGRDRGIDLRYSTSSDKAALIVQSKHYLASGFHKLKRVLEKSERDKIEQLAPKRYILTTSVGLTPGEKDQLADILRPFCRGTGDIYGSQDLNGLLSKYGDIERQHFKLWLPSTEVLQRLLHNGVFTRSALEIGDIKRQLSLFVPTNAVQRGINLLEKNGFCMLTGIPGIGKTTTARILFAHHVEQEWDGYYLASSASEAFDAFRPEERQIFFYDDFLGQTSLDEKLHKNEDKQLLQLIQACRNHPRTKRLVLTTREYLFEQAKQQHETLTRAHIELAECTVELRDYTTTIRADILVNHLFFFGVDPDVCSTFVMSGDARKTIDHENYNPRIVETMCEFQNTARLGPQKFGRRFLQMLDSPEGIWGHAYEHQLTPHARHLVLVFAILGSDITIDTLKHEFRVYAQNSGMGVIGIDALFRRCIEELEGTFLSVHPHEKLTYVTYHTPAIKDFCDAQLKVEDGFLSRVLDDFTYEETLATAARLLVENAPMAVSGKQIIEAIQRADRSTAFRVAAGRFSIVPKQPPSQFETLGMWLRIAAKLSEAPASQYILELAERLLREEDPRGYAATYFIDLFNECREIAASAGLGITLSVEEFADRVMEHCDDPEEFLAMNKLLDSCDNPDELRARLRGSFPKQTEKWLKEQVNRASSGESIDEAIGALVDAAGEFGYSEADFELDQARARAADLENRADREADMQQEEWELQRYQDRTESAAIDDILDSIRE